MSNTGKTYRRKTFDPLLHCGAPVDRNLDSIIEKLGKWQRLVNELQSKIDAGDDIGAEGMTRLKKRLNRVQWFTRAAKKIEDQGPDDRPCVKSRGQETDHPGVGLCRWHCACKGRNGGHLSYYTRKAKDKRLADIVEEMEASEEEILNLEPEIRMLRGKMRLFLEDKQDFEPETVKSLTLIAEQLRKTVDSVMDKRWKVSISLDRFTLLMHRMGETVAKYVTEEDVRDRIVAEWQKITLEEATKQNRAITAGAIAVEARDME